MRALERNKRPIYYALFDRKEEIKDEYGNGTGEFKIIYKEPVKTEMNISAAQGERSIQQFGDSTNYDRVIVTTDMDCPIDEMSILWVDNLDTSQPHDYVVSKVGDSLNNISIAIKKVDVGA